MNAYLLKKNCGAFKSRGDCEKFFVFIPPGSSTKPSVDSFGSPRPERQGSCGWDGRTKKCGVLAPIKEPCLRFGTQAEVTQSREFSKRFEGVSR